MIDSFYIGAYWGSRGESLNKTSEKIISTLNALNKIDPQFSNWYHGATSRKNALEQKIQVTKSKIDSLCLELVRKDELSDDGFSNNGFNVGIWSGHKDEESSSISFNTGQLFNSPYLSNSCVITIPFEGEARKRLLQQERARNIISTLTDIWEPDYAILSSKHLREILHIGNQVGWITFQKTVKNIERLGKSVLYENNGNGWIFYLNLPNNKSYDYNSINELITLKAILEIGI